MLPIALAKRNWMPQKAIAEALIFYTQQAIDRNISEQKSDTSQGKTR